MKKLLFFSVSIILFIILTFQILFIFWLNDFVALYIEYTDRQVGFIEDNLFFLYTNVSPLAIMLFNQDKIYVAGVLKTKKFTAKQFCIKTNPQYAPYLKFKTACKPLEYKLTFLDNLFCKYPILTLNMIQSCNTLTIRGAQHSDNLKRIYITNQGLKLKNEN